MQSKIKLIGGLFALLILVGGGCAAPGQTDIKDAEQPQKDAEKEMVSEETKTKSETTGITITKAEATETGTLEIELSVEEKLKESAEAFRLILSSDEKAEWPTKGYWYELGTAHTSKTWTDLPSGERHLRACIVKANECEVYSDIHKVEVK